MSKHETPMTRWYWRRVGGTLMEEFCAVPRSKDCGTRVLDAVIIKGGPTRRARRHDASLIEGKDIVVVQTKAARLGMYLMGQVLFSAKLMKKFKPRSIESVALVAQDDAELRPLLERYRGMRVVVYPGKGRRDVNAEWHEKHRMPRNATPAQRLRWHETHAKHCACRPFTPAMRERLQRAVAARSKRWRVVV